MASPIDKYAHDDKGDKSQAWEDLPPKVAPPMLGTDAVLQLYAPKDETMLDLGAGKRSGIRMVTNKHVHLTARDPLTTISLGAPGGLGINDASGAGDGASGLQVYSEGKKVEQIDGAVREIYGDQKIETVKGAVWETYEDTKKEIVIKDIENEYHGNKKETIAEQLHVSSKARIEKVDGDWHMHVTGHKHEKVDGDSSWTRDGQFGSITLGSITDACLGEKISLVAGQNASCCLGMNVGVSVVGKLDMVIGASVATTSNVKVSVDRMTVAKTTAKIEHTDYQYKNEPTKLTKSDLELISAQSRIHSAALLIIK
jgi:hypothetical protein